MRQIDLLHPVVIVDWGPHSLAALYFLSDRRTSPMVCCLELCQPLQASFEMG